MNELMLLLQVGLVIWMLVTVVIYFSRRGKAHKTWRTFQKNAQPVRQLTMDEQAAVHEAFKHSKIVSSDVYLLEGKASIQGMRSNRGNDLHLVVDGVQLKPFPQWTIYIRPGSNRVEVVRAKRSGDAVPVSINGVSLADAIQRKKDGTGVDYAVVRNPDGISAQVVSEDEAGGDLTGDARVVGKQQEAPRDAVLRKSNAANNAGMLFLAGVGLAMVLVASLLPGVWQWIGVLGGALIVYAGWKLLREWRAPLAGKPVTITTLEGRLGIRKVAGKNDRDPTVATKMLVGNTAVTYPTDAWEVLAKRDMLSDPQRKHRVSVDDKNVVVKYDGLSIYEQHERYPVPRWGRYLMMVIIGVPLAIAAWWWGGPVVGSLQTARARLSHTTRHLTPATPQALVDAKPVAGDLLTVKGIGQCFGGSDEQDVTLLRRLTSGDSVRCRQDGWTKPTRDQLFALLKYKLGATDWQMPTGLFVLAVFAEDLSSTTGDAYRQRLAQIEHHSYGGLDRRVNLNTLVVAADTACESHDLNACLMLEVKVRSLAGYKLDWPALVKKAGSGQLPNDAAVPDFEVRPLQKDIGDVLHAAIHSEQLRLLARGREQPASVVFATLGRAIGTSKSESTDFLLDRLRETSMRAMVLLPVIQLQNMPFSLTGEVRKVSRKGGGLHILVDAQVQRQSLFALVAAPLICLLSLLLVVVGVFGTVRLWPLRKRMKAAEAQYIVGRA